MFTRGAGNQNKSTGVGFGRQFPLLSNPSIGSSTYQTSPLKRGQQHATSSQHSFLGASQRQTTWGQQTQQPLFVFGQGTKTKANLPSKDLGKPSQQKDGTFKQGFLPNAIFQKADASTIGSSMFDMTKNGTGSSLSQSNAFSRQTNSVFGPSFTNTPFPSNPNQTIRSAESTIKFKPVLGTDTATYNGTSFRVNTRMQCITTMKEYENKSIEELRLDDYALTGKCSQIGTYDSGFNMSQTNNIPNKYIFPSFTKAPNHESITFLQPSITGSGFCKLEGLGSLNPSFQTKPIASSSSSWSASSSPLTNKYTTNTVVPSVVTSTVTSTTNTFQPSKPILFTPASNGFQTCDSCKQNLINGATNNEVPQTSNTSVQSFNPSTIATTPINQVPGCNFPPNNVTSQVANNISAPLSVTQTNKQTLGSSACTLLTQIPVIGFSATCNIPISGNLNLMSANTFAPVAFVGIPLHTYQDNSRNEVPPFAITAFKEDPILSHHPGPNEKERSYVNNMLKRDTDDILLQKTRRSVNSYTSLAMSSRLSRLTFPNPETKKHNSLLTCKTFDGFEDEDYGIGVDILCPKTDRKTLMVKKTIEKNVNSYTTLKQRLRIAMHDVTNQDNEITQPISMKEPIPIVQTCNMPGNTELVVKDEIRLESSTDPALPHKSGVICTRHGYYTIPSIEELDKRVDPRGNCFIDGLEIGRQNFGRIRFLNTVNVAGLNIDEIVMFCHKVLLLYPDESHKPAYGEGLNCPAEIEMENVWPMDPVTKDLIKSSEKIQEINYESKLRRACRRMDADFISYCSHTGIWRFRIVHC